MSYRIVSNYNQDFIEVMDSVNYVAKCMGYANGISWAFQQFEDKILNECNLSYFNNCNDLRKLLARGYDCGDINITYITLQKAQFFLSVIDHPDNLKYDNQNKLFKKVNPDPPKDDYNYDLPY